MTEQSFDTLAFVGRRVPDHSMEVDSNGNNYRRELPGMYEVGFLLDGVFRPIYTMKAGKLLAQLEQAQKAKEGVAPSGESSSSTE